MFVFCRKEKKRGGGGSGLYLSTFILTYTEGVLLELRGEVRDVCQTVKVSLQDVPAHLIVKRVPELCWHLGDVDKNRPGRTAKSYIIMIYLCLHFCSWTPPSGLVQSLWNLAHKLPRVPRLITSQYGGWFKYLRQIKNCWVFFCIFVSRTCVTEASL